MRRLLIALFLLLNALPALAVNPDEILSNPVLEQRARNLSGQLRCMVCQNQSIDDSDAPLARDLRVLVRERVQAGDSDRQVIGFLVSRYGEVVLLKPRFSLHTALLWLGTLAVVLIGAVGQAFDEQDEPVNPATEAALRVMRDDVAWWANVLDRARAEGQLAPGNARFMQELAALRS